MITVALVAGIRVVAAGELAPRLLVVGAANAPGAGLPDGIALPVAVQSRPGRANALVRSVVVRSVAAVGMPARIAVASLIRGAGTARFGGP